MANELLTVLLWFKGFFSLKKNLDPKSATFRFLACVKNGIDMTAIEKDLYADSWEKSVDTTVQLFNYFRVSITIFFTLL